MTTIKIIGKVKLTDAGQAALKLNPRSAYGKYSGGNVQNVLSWRKVWQTFQDDDNIEITIKKVGK